MPSKLLIRAANKAQNKVNYFIYFICKITAMKLIIIHFMCTITFFILCKESSLKLSGRLRYEKVLFTLKYVSGKVYINIFLRVLTTANLSMI